MSGILNATFAQPSGLLKKTKANIQAILTESTRDQREAPRSLGRLQGSNSSFPSAVSSPFVKKMGS